MQSHDLDPRRASRRKRVLYVSSPIGLGHARRDLAIVEELRQLPPDLQVDWLAQDPVTAVLEARGRDRPPGQRVARLRVRRTSPRRPCGHDLHCFQALRRMDEILVANFMVFQEVVEDGLYDLVVGDEAWDVDHFWHENPELKRGAHVWLTDFVGFLPMPDGGDHEAFLTADYNAEMIEHIADFPRIRDRSIFVGNPDDVVARHVRPGPARRSATGPRRTSTSPATSPGSPHRHPTRRPSGGPSSGYRDDELICVVTVGGSGVGRDLLELAIAAHPLARRRSRACARSPWPGRASTPRSLPSSPGLEVHGYVDRLYRHLAVCDLAVVQGGLTTTMELAAAKRPFLYFPLAHHFEQNFHVRHRLDQYGAGVCMDFATRP